MPELFDIEDIEETRRQDGVEDSILQRRIRRLHIGDLVRLKIWLGERASETLTFQISKVREAGFDGVLLEKPTCGDLSDLKVGLRIPFASRHIHSIGKGPSRVQPL